MERRLTVVLEAAPEGGYLVSVPALPEVVTEGDTIEEAMAAAAEAVACALLSRQDLGEPAPDDVPYRGADRSVIVRRLLPSLADA